MAWGLVVGAPRFWFHSLVVPLPTSMALLSTSWSHVLARPPHQQHSSAWCVFATPKPSGTNSSHSGSAQRLDQGLAGATVLSIPTQYGQITCVTAQQGCSFCWPGFFSWGAATQVRCVAR
ncbi:hypothetical protein BKA81DRAFT_362256 [Phyllosticta paracitricarpa]